MISNHGFIFRRTALALQIVEGLTGSGLVDFRSGLFLTAPRRTGKSTFLREDLAPACVERGWLPVYVDLWEDKNADPALLIAAAIARALAPFDGALRRLAKKMGVKKLSLLSSFSWDFSKPSLPEGATLAQALELLHVVSQKMIVLMIDEAQHALSTDSGTNAMFALKAARDELNQGRESDGLRLVCTGSSRDKLAHLVLNAKQPFFGSSVTPFPLLGRDYTETYTAHLNKLLAKHNQFKPAEVEAAFDKVGRRPELLRNIISSVSLDLGAASDLGTLLYSGAQSIRDGICSEFESNYNGLTLAQKAVLEVMARRCIADEPFSPFSTETLQAVAIVMSRLGNEIAPGMSTIQASIDELRQKELLWKSSRGAYAFEDKGMAHWLVETLDAALYVE
jgi:hypothetical protein